MPLKFYTAIRVMFPETIRESRPHCDQFYIYIKLLHSLFTFTALLRTEWRQSLPPVISSLNILQWCWGKLPVIHLKAVIRCHNLPVLCPVLSEQVRCHRSAESQRVTFYNLHCCGKWKLIRLKHRWIFYRKRILCRIRNFGWYFAYFRGFRGKCCLLGGSFLSRT